MRYFRSFVSSENIRNALFYELTLIEIVKNIAT